LPRIDARIADAASSPAAMSVFAEPATVTATAIGTKADPNDRRKVLVESADKTHELIEAIYHPVFEAGAKLLSNYTLEEMKLILGFMEEVTTMQQELTDALLKQSQSTTKG
jgi:DNA-binding MarR family transcriptional regulator